MAGLANGRPGPLRIVRPGDRTSLSKSATRALDILEYFSTVRRPLRAIEIAHALDLHPSTTDQLLKTMLGSAHVTFDTRTKTYMPSPRLIGFSSWMIDLYGANDRLRALVRDLAEQTRDVVTLTSPCGLFMQVIDSAGYGPFRDRTERGLKIALFGSSIGSAYLSTLSDADIARLAYRSQIADAQIPELLKSVARIRAEGIADGPSPDRSTWSIAVPLPPQASPIPLVLGFSGSFERVSVENAGLKSLIHDAVTRHGYEHRSSPEQAMADAV